MQEYNDGTFGKIKDFNELQELLKDGREMEKTKAIHFGTTKELEKLKAKGIKKGILKRFKYLFTSKYMPHQGNQERVRRMIQIKKGILKVGCK